MSNWHRTTSKRRLRRSRSMNSEYVARRQRTIWILHYFVYSPMRYVGVYPERIRTLFSRRDPARSWRDSHGEQLLEADDSANVPVSYTHLTLPTIYSV